MTRSAPRAARPLPEPRLRAAPRPRGDVTLLCASRADWLRMTSTLSFFFLFFFPPSSPPLLLTPPPPPPPRGMTSSPAHSRLAERRGAARSSAAARHAGPAERRGRPRPPHRVSVSRAGPGREGTALQGSGRGARCGRVCGAEPRKGWGRCRCAPLEIPAPSFTCALIRTAFRV